MSGPVSQIPNLICWSSNLDEVIEFLGDSFSGCVNQEVFIDNGRGFCGIDRYRYVTPGQWIYRHNERFFVLSSYITQFLNPSQGDVALAA